MAWNLFEEKPKVLFQEPFSSKYILTIDTDMMAGNVPISTKTEIRWQAEVKNISEEGNADLCLTILHHRLLESNNPMVKDIAAVSEVFSKMYSELELRINKKGKVLKIKNYDTILKKWEWTKADLTNIIRENENLKDIIRLNDELFTEPGKITTAIESGEFFMVYFHYVFGERYPDYFGRVSKPTLLNTAKLDWAYTTYHMDRPQYYKSTKRNQALHNIGVSGYPRTSINKDWIKEAYAPFSHLPLKDLKPEFEESAFYTYEHTGKLLHAVIEKKETVHPVLLYARHRYEMAAEEEAEKQAPPQQEWQYPPGYKSWLID